MLMRPKNWDDFQHYKDRLPPWIKLHRSLLTDREFMCLPIASKALAPLLWLLASESKDGSFDGSLDELQFRLHISRKDYEDGIKPLIDKGFFIVDSDVLAECLQVATPERETEREAETKRETKATVVATPEGVSQSVWEDFVKHRKAKKAQVTQTVIDGITKEAKKAGWPLEDALKETILRNWQSFKADWVANKSFAFQREDIARVTVPGSTDPDPALMKIEQDRKNAAPMPAHIRQQINQVLRKA